MSNNASDNNNPPSIPPPPSNPHNTPESPNTAFDERFGYIMAYIQDLKDEIVGAQRTLAELSRTITEREDDPTRIQVDQLQSKVAAYYGTLRVLEEKWKKFTGEHTYMEERDTLLEEMREIIRQADL